MLTSFLVVVDGLFVYFIPMQMQMQMAHNFHWIGGFSQIIRVNVTDLGKMSTHSKRIMKANPEWCGRYSIFENCMNWEDLNDIKFHVNNSIHIYCHFQFQAQAFLWIGNAQIIINAWQFTPRSKESLRNDKINTKLWAVSFLDRMFQLLSFTPVGNLHSFFRFR